MALRRRTTWLVVLGVLVLLVAVGVTGVAVSRGGPSGEASDPMAVTPRLGRYVALGDSYTAAPGVPETDTADPCLRSTNSYPHLLDRALSPTGFADVSCSGAETADLAERQAGGGASLAPQLDALTHDTALVTLGIGGNDSGVFGTLVGACAFLRGQDPGGAPCRTAMRSGGTDRLLSAVTRTGTRVRAAVTHIRRLSPRARVLLVGYPQIVPATGTCVDRLPLATGDYPYARTVNRALDRMLRAAAAATGATYVDVWRASAGHDICSATPWVNGRASDTGRAIPFHPFEVEQQAVASLVVAAARRLGLPTGD